LIRHNNNVSATLTAGISNSVLLIPVSSPSSFSSSGVVTVTDSLTAPTKIEIINYTSKSGSDLVVPASGGRGAEGTTAQSFSSGHFVEQRVTARSFSVLADSIIAMQTKLGLGVFPASNTLFTNTNSGSGVVNTTTETSLFTVGTGVPASSGSSRIIAADSAANGSVYRLRFEGLIGTTGTPTARFKIKFGSTSICDSTAFAMPNNTAGGFSIRANIFVYAAGGSGQVRTHMEGQIMANFSGIQTITNFGNLEQAAVVFTSDQTIDLSLQWGTANPANTAQLTGVSIERLR
jgi:hypothetical protein